MATVLNYTTTTQSSQTVCVFDTVEDYKYALSNNMVLESDIVYIKELVQYIDRNTLPSQTGNSGMFLTTNGSTTSWGTVSQDFTHMANTTVSGSTTTVTFAANQRGSAMLTISADLGLTIACNNEADNYLWIKNTGSAEVDVTISAVTKNSTAVSNVYVPSDGITVPAGGLCEIGVIVNSEGAFITSRNDLAL